jgi:hypothetical protein
MVNYTRWKKYRCPYRLAEYDRTITYATTTDAPIRTGAVTTGETTTDGTLHSDILKFSVSLTITGVKSNRALRSLKYVQYVL